MKIKENIFYVGVNDHNIDLFEGQYIVPNGMSYNSFVIMDEKIVIMDTVDQNFGNEWLNNIKQVISSNKPDYLVVHHMEPDHSANINLITKEYPEITIVSSAMSFEMMKNFYGITPERKIIVKEGDKLNLGLHELTFISAPMVHWPEVFVSYESYEKVLFSADGFGKFGALDIDEEWDCEARRYYFGIVGKFGVNVQALLKKVQNLNIEIICPLHGPVLNENLEHYINQYNIWSSYNVESEGVFIAYTSVYGNTKKAVKLMEEILTEKGCKKVAVADLAREDMAEAVEDAFRYGKIILATTTYNTEIFPKMREFIDELLGKNYQNKKIGLIENGSWAPTAAKIMKEKFSQSKNIEFASNVITIKSAVNEENKIQISLLADEILK